MLATEQLVLSPDPRIGVRTEGPGTFLLILKMVNSLDAGEYVSQVQE